jgi:hypothetical protein
VVRPNKPELYEPFVHIFNRRGGEHRRKSPKNIFNMPDLYTIFAGGHATSALSNTSAGWNTISCACAS